MRKWLLGFSTIGVLLGGAREASASGGPPIHLILRECSDIREAEVERVIAAELKTETTQNDDAPDPTWIVGICEDERVSIEVTDAISRKSLKRSFLLTGAAPEARSRLVGIAAAELVLASWSELALRPALRVEPEGKPPSPEHASAAVNRARASPPPAAAPAPAALPVAAAATPGPSMATPSAAELPPENEPTQAERDARGEERRHNSTFDLRPRGQRMFRFVPMASSRWFTNTAGSLVGGGLRVGEEPMVNASWALDTLYESGTVNNYRVYTWTVGALLYLYGRVGIVTARVGAGLRAGVTAADSVSRQSTTATAVPWGWPMVAASLSLGSKGSLQLELSGESGYVSMPFVPQSIWVAAQLGIGFSP